MGSRFGLASLFAISIVILTEGPTVAGAAMYDSQYQFESAFLGNLKPGDTGTFSVFFANIGTVTWVAGTTTQVNLGACGDDKVTCNVAPAQASWNPGTWLSATAYATHSKVAVAPGDFSAFTYNIKVPPDATTGLFRFHGDLVVASTGARIHPEGYYQDATVSSITMGATAPSDVQIQVGSFDGGSTNNDVRVFFTAPASNPTIGYDVQRAQGHCGIAVDSPFWLKISTLTLAGGVFGAYNDLDRPPGFYCYQVRLSNGGASFVYSKQIEATVFGAASTGGPISTSAILLADGGNAGTMDATDRFAVTFSAVMQLAPTARIRVSDTDVGNPTLSDIYCGSNANCFLSLDGKTITVTMSGSPVDVSSGSNPGAQYPLTFVDSSGITDTNGTQWSVTTSSDRTIGPVGQ
jgi:hypothetical protein